MKDYSKPDKTEWPEADPRIALAGFDEGFFREQYNAWMPPEQPSLALPDIGLNVLEAVFVPSIETHGGATLDIGCGNGRLLLALMQKQFIYSGKGIDISDAMVENAKLSAENNELILDFERTAIEDFSPDTQYDTILATEILEHVYNLRDILKIIASWLQEDGMLCGTVPLEHVCDAPVHLHYFTEDSLSRLLKAFFINVAIETIDATGEGENHLVFICQYPLRSVYKSIHEGRIMNKISMLMPVHNEEQFLRYALENTLRYVDEAIIVDGSPWGPSTDGTANIIDDFDRLYPGKINYSSGIFALENGAWDESAHRNLALSKVTGNILMPHCGDMIYTNEDMAKMVATIDRFRDKKIIYCPFVEFWLDQRHIRMYPGHALEAWYPVLAISDINFVSMEIVKHYYDGPSLLIEGYTPTDFMYVHDATRYHYGWLTGFGPQVRKHIRNMTMGAWLESDIHIEASDEVGIAKWAINHVLEYAINTCCFDYHGRPPIDGDHHYLNGYDDTIVEFEQKFGEGFWK